MEKIYNWVEESLGDKIQADIESSLINHNEFDPDTYSKSFVDNNFKENDLIELKKVLNKYNDDSEDKEADDDNFDLSTLTFEMPQDESPFDLMSPDELINQGNWKQTQEKLKEMIIYGTSVTTALKIYQRLLTYYNSPRTVCEGFSSLTEVISSLIEISNRMEEEETYEIRNSKLGKKTESASSKRELKGFKDSQIQKSLFKSVYLLMEVQKGMPSLWIRFNERRLTEIISSFVYLLSRSFTLDSNAVTAFDIVSTLSVTGVWCKHWCHGAMGRTLLCLTLRKRKRFFDGIVEIIVMHLLQTNGKIFKDKWLLDIPVLTLHSARFTHAFSIVSYILGCRMGRALFPVCLSTKRRPWTVSDILGLMIDHVEGTKKDDGCSQMYKEHILDMGKRLEVVQKEFGTPRTPRSYR